MRLSADQRGFARSLRRHQTSAEMLIWYHLRGRRFMNLRFRRQHPIGPYFADFACLDVQLVIELDGGQHNRERGIERDAARTAFLASQGFVVLRFWDNDVLRAPMGVLGAIADAVRAMRRKPEPSPAHCATSPAYGRGEAPMPSPAHCATSPAYGRGEAPMPSPDLAVDLSRRSGRGEN